MTQVWRVGDVTVDIGDPLVVRKGRQMSQIWKPILKTLGSRLASESSVLLKTIRALIKTLSSYTTCIFQGHHRNHYMVSPQTLLILDCHGVSWPSGLAYRTQVLVLAAECGFESRPWHLCPWARHLIIIASLHPGVKWVPVRAELVD